MNETLEGLRDTFCLPCLDNISVYSKSFDEHLKHLKYVFQRLREKGLKLKPSKCHLFQKSVRYLVHLITTTVHTTNPSDITAVKKLRDVKSDNKCDSLVSIKDLFQNFHEGLNQSMTYKRGNQNKTRRGKPNWPKRRARNVQILRCSGLLSIRKY